ncbi:septum formation initiator family protein [Microbacteriaceae bacterium 4G12]
MRELRKTYVREENPASVSQHTIQSEDRSRKRLFRRLTFFLAFALTIIVSIAITFYKQGAVAEERKNEITKLQKEMNSLTAEEKNLKDEITKLNDDDYIAQIARSEYFFSKPGEVIYPIKK